MADPSIMFAQPNAGASFAQAFQQGMEKNRENAVRSAMAALVQDPNNAQALGALAKLDPAIAMDFRAQQAKLSQENVKQFQTTIDAGASAMQRLTSQGMPLEQAYQTVRQTLISNGFPGAEHIPPQADEQYIKSIMALAKPDAGSLGTSDIQNFEYSLSHGFKGDFPSYLQLAHPPSPISIPGGGSITYPGQGGGSGGLPHVSTPQEASTLPPGTQFVLPDGRIGTVPGGAGGNASGGFQ